MAKATKRTKVTAPPAQLIQNWDEADQALVEIGKLEQEIKNKEAAYNQDELDRREKLNEKLAPKRDRIAELAAGLKNYCDANRNEFDKKKTKELTHGKLSYRLGTPKLATLKNWTFGAALEMIKKMGMGDLFVRTKEELNKEAVLEAYANNIQSNGEQGCSAKELADYGLEVKQDETFAYEVRLAID